MTAAPVWVTDLVAKVSREYDVAEPDRLVWRRSRTHVMSSGRCSADRLVVTAGSDRRDQRSVLLHEMAHHVMHKRRWRAKWHHDDEFYRVYFEMVKADGRVPLRYAVERETRYRKEAGVTAKALGIRGATKALRERKARRRPRYLRCPLGVGCRIWGPSWIPSGDHTHAEGTVIIRPEGNVVIGKKEVA